MFCRSMRGFSTLRFIDWDGEARFYALTPAGRDQLKSEKARWAEYSKAVHSILRSSEV